MGAYMCIKIEGTYKNKKKIEETMKKFGAKRIGFYQDTKSDWYDAMYSGWWGYAEPLELYEKHKNLFKDIWYLDISTSVKIERNHPDKWYSCKQEFATLVE